MVRQPASNSPIYSFAEERISQRGENVAFRYGRGRRSSLKLLFLQGSLRRKGSTEGLVDHVVDYLSERYPFVECEAVHLCDRQIDMCHSCYACDQGGCPLDDDVPEIVRAMLEADGIVYAFPVYAFGVNSVMQIFLERSGVGNLRFERPLEGKLAAILVTGRRYGHEAAWAQVALNVMLNKMILVGSGFPSVIKNDGKKLGSTILDVEGLRSTRKTLDKLVEMFTRLYPERFAETEFEMALRETDSELVSSPKRS